LPGESCFSNLLRAATQKTGTFVFSVNHYISHWNSTMQYNDTNHSMWWVGVKADAIIIK